jgi:ankyrin repeat protein
MELHEAVEEEDIEAVKQHLADGADVNAKNPNGETPLDLAIGYKQTEIADLIRKHGGKSGAEYSIHVAASLGNIEAVKQHLATGTNVKLKNAKGATPLLYAAIGGHKEIAELLIEKSADVNVKDGDGGTPLHHATNKEIAELLIDKVADVNAKNWEGLTPLHYAAFTGRKEIAELLIAAGADVNVKDDNGNTPLDWAIGYKQTEIAALLRKHGGKTGEELEAEGK